MIRTLIIDDEPLARENIILRLDKETDFNICGQADNGQDAQLLARKMNPDVIFLDIEMPGIKGIDAAQKILEISNALIVFVTAFDQFAIKAFQINALDYLQKPINDKLFEKTLERIRQNLKHKKELKQNPTSHPQSQQYLKRLGIKDVNSISMIDVNSIKLIEVAGDYLCIMADNQNYVHRQPLTSLLQLLDPASFIRIHRSHAININFLRSFHEESGGAVVLMQNGRSLPVSRRYQKSFLKKINT